MSFYQIQGYVMKVYHSLSAILTDPIPPFPPQLIPILIQHLTQPFHGALIDAEDYWKTQAVQLIFNPTSTPIDQIPEYTQTLTDQYSISLYLIGDAGQGYYHLINTSKETS
jgi:hypothetical protein